jgi:hypothetical protein
LIGEVSEEERSIEKLIDVLMPTGDSSWRILPIEVIAKGSFGREVVDD